ncbi:MAG: hypothetical protein IKQ63_02635 [Eubacterium sp.]|nr:hypothetical protein [Eubacterium sp.]
MKKHIDKGDYGYAKKYKNRRIIFTMLCFICILADILIGLIMFQSRKTLFTVVACVMALPFAKNLIGYIMVVGFKPLTEKEHETTEKLAAEHGLKFYYDISASDQERMLFYPCVAVVGKSVYGLVQPPKGESISDELRNRARSKDSAHMELHKKYEKCLEQINEGTSDKANIRIISNINDFAAAIRQTGKASEEGQNDSKKAGRENKKIVQKLLAIGV